MSFETGSMLGAHPEGMKECRGLRSPHVLDWFV
jgi:hypothetical protein